MSLLCWFKGCRLPMADQHASGEVQMCRRCGRAWRLIWDMQNSILRKRWSTM